ncbi:MAG: putative ABC transporter permease [Saccharofermentanales bacterium]
MDLSFYQILWIFVIYSFIGWCTEVVYAASSSGRFVNRGFLNGPVCPIYGFGVLFVLLALTPLKDNLLLLFLGSVLLTSVLELITGFLLEMILDDKWWDYTDEPFNIKGYICLRFSLMWGVACVLVMIAFQPLVMGFIEMLPDAAGLVLLIFFLAAIASDLAITLASALHLKKRLRILNEVGGHLESFSVLLGEPLSGKVMVMKEKLDEGMDNLDDLKSKSKAELDELMLRYNEDLAALKMKLKYKRLAALYKLNQNRLLKSFPRLQTGRHKENLEWLKRLIDGFSK